MWHTRCNPRDTWEGLRNTAAKNVRSGGILSNLDQIDDGVNQSIRLPIQLTPIHSSHSLIGGQLPPHQASITAAMVTVSGNFTRRFLHPRGGIGRPNSDCFCLHPYCIQPPPLTQPLTHLALTTLQVTTTHSLSHHSPTHSPTHHTAGKKHFLLLHSSCYTLRIPSHRLFSGTLTITMHNSRNTL